MEATIRNAFRNSSWIPSGRWCVCRSNEVGGSGGTRGTDSVSMTQPPHRMAHRFNRQQQWMNAEATIPQKVIVFDCVHCAFSFTKNRLRLGQCLWVGATLSGINPNRLWLDADYNQLNNGNQLNEMACNFSANQVSSVSERFGRWSNDEIVDSRIRKVPVAWLRDKCHVSLFFVILIICFV